MLGQNLRQRPACPLSELGEIKILATDCPLIFSERP